MNTRNKMTDCENIPAEAMLKIYREEWENCFRKVADNVEENVTVV
jgi:hypothetical protein